MKKTIALASLAALILVSTARADGVAVTLVPVGMPLGLGVDVTYRLSSHFNVRAGAGVPTDATGEDVEFGDVSYDMTMKFGGVNAFVDWHPFAGNFHVSGGLTSLRDPWSLKARNSSTYVINGSTYPASGVGQLTGQIAIANSIAPALLVGWGNPVRPGKRWGFLIELGVAYGGREDFVLKADGSLAQDPAFQGDLAAESEIQSADHAFWPVLKAGVSFQF